MPKKVNSHRLAAQAIRLSDALSAALQGQYEIGLIEAALGNCSFRVALSSAETRVVSITSKVLKGGRSSAARAERGCFLIVDKQEVVGVVNNSKDLKALTKAGRVPSALLSGADGSSGGLDDFFEVDRSAKSDELDIWAKRDEESVALAAEIEARIRRRRAGVAVRNAVAPLLALDDSTPVEVEVVEEAEVAEPVVPEEGSAEAPAAGRGVITSARRLRAMALKAAAEEAAIQAEIAAARAELEARLAAARAEEEQLEKLMSHAAPDCWEDEIDIDAI
jgi:hypothetical protein